MRCQNCNLREATVTLIQTKNGERQTRHLCHACAEEETFFGRSIFDSLFESPFADFFETPASRATIADRLKQTERAKKREKESKRNCHRKKKN